MIDFHSHILPGIDDGSRNMEQSIQILKEAKEAGFSKVISTSHYMEEYFECDETKRRELLDNLQKNIDGIDLYLGSEIYITNNIVDLIKENSASSINDTKYVLFEFPLIDNLFKEFSCLMQQSSPDILFIDESKLYEKESASKFGNSFRRAIKFNKSSSILFLF